MTARILGATKLSKLPLHWTALAVAAGAFATSFAAPAMATENGNMAYPIGLNTFATGVIPASGDHFYDYTVYYDANRTNNSNGDASVKNYHVDSDVTSVRMIHAFDTNWGPFRPSLDIALPFAYIDLHTPKAHDHTTNIGDLNLGFILSRHGQTFQDYAEVKVFIPTGAYNKADLVNTGRGYSSEALFYGATYLPADGFDLGALLAYTFNNENSDTKYASGQEFALEYSGHWRASPHLYVGVGGYYYRQTTADELKSIQYLDGHYGETAALGPEVRYAFGKFGVGLKMQEEFEAKNRPEGRRLWLQVYVPLGAVGPSR